MSGALLLLRYEAHQDEVSLKSIALIEIQLISYLA
jgi:hypothetical protein